MLNWGDDDELERIVNNLTDLMLSMCQDCRFIAAAKVIESVDINVAKELQISLSYRLNDSDIDPGIYPIKEPKHRIGGCYAYSRS
jgi:hypothetical protein